MALRALRAFAGLAAVAASAESTVDEGTCVQDAVSAVQARRAVPEVHDMPEESAGVEPRNEYNPSLLLHKDLHLEVPEELEKSRIGMLAKLQRGRVSMHQEYNCLARPHMCEAPFNCQTWTLKDTLELTLNGLATENGHVNPRSWCLPGAEEFADNMVKECLVNHDFHTSAKMRKSRSNDLSHMELDASYCFAEGHCSNEAVTDNTTMEDTEAMCDHRFGRAGWTTDLLKSFTRSFSSQASRPSALNMKHGFNSRMVTMALTKMSCAQGTYHCDVQNCKHTYCKDAHYIAKYSFLKPQQAGHLIQDLSDEV